jgi:YggT family protein
MSEPSLRDRTLADDASRRAIQHESVKASVQDDVNTEIAQQASQAPPNGEARAIEHVAGTFRKNAVDEIVDDERKVKRSRGVARVSQFIDYGFFLIYALLAIRFLLSLIAARSSAGFVRFIVSVTEPFYAPFNNIVASPKTGDGHTLLLPMVVALGAYLVLHLAINRLLRLFVVRKTEV